MNCDFYDGKVVMRIELTFEILKTGRAKYNRQSKRR